MITFDEFETQWLEEVQADSPSTTQLGNRFAQKLLKDWQEIDDATAEIILCDGAGDGGIDAAIFLKSDPNEEVDGDTWLLVQSKYGSSYGGLGTISTEAQKLFATLEGKRSTLSSLSSELVQRLRTFLENKSEKDKLEYVLATSRKLSDEDMDYLNNVRVLGRDKFGACFDVDTISVETIYNKVCEEQQSAGDELSVNLKTLVTESTTDLLIGPTSLRSIFSFLQEYRARSGDLDMLYERNVRKFLGNKRKVNKAIEKTLEESPERFGLYNNGITIVAERLERKTGDQLVLINPAIVNGCQTTKTIWNVLQKKLNAGGTAPSEAHKLWEQKLDRGVVVTKIVVVGPEGEELLTDTTRYTNFQNAVGEKDFMALEKDFKTWSAIFNSKHNVFLEIQRGAWEARRAYQRQNPLSQPQFSEFANAFELLKTYAAGWLVEPGIAYGKNPPFAPGGSQFKKITNDPTFGVESLFAAYQTQKLANSYGFGRRAQRPSRGQTRYLFVAAFIDLLKDLLVYAGKNRDNATISRAVVSLSEAGLLSDIGDVAVGVVDDYLTQGGEDTIYLEPEFAKTSDLNAFLKSEKLFKSDDFSPNLRMQLALAKKQLRRGGETEAVRSVIAQLDATNS